MTKKTLKKRAKKFYVILTSVFIYLLHLPFAFAKSATGTNKLFRAPGDSVKLAPTEASFIPSKSFSVYDSLHLDLSGLSNKAFDFARKGFEKLLAQGKLLNDSIIAIVDFSQPSNKKRLYVIDMKNYKVLHHTLVAHGKNSGSEWANSFSNTPNSLQSSPGFYVTGQTYIGNNGYSLRLNGMEPGINDKALERTIVMHGADYISYARANSGSFVGRSWGCPAVPRDEAVPIINHIKNGSCLFIYTPSENYLSRSRMLN
jgi:hypothetical protein